MRRWIVHKAIICQPNANDTNENLLYIPYRPYSTVYSKLALVALALG